MSSSIASTETFSVIGATERALTFPDNVTLALLPPYSPELNPVERV